MASPWVLSRSTWLLFGNVKMSDAGFVNTYNTTAEAFAALDIYSYSFVFQVLLLRQKIQTSLILKCFSVHTHTHTRMVVWPLIGAPQLWSSSSHHFNYRAFIVCADPF